MKRDRELQQAAALFNDARFFCTMFVCDLYEHESRWYWPKSENSLDMWAWNDANFHMTRNW